MLINTITKERLTAFYKNCKYLEKLKQEVEGFKKNYNFLKGSDYSATRVTSGTKKQSEEEMFVQLCERKSKEYEALKTQLETEKENITMQIKRLTNPTYKTILIRRYLQLKSWKEITLELYGSKDDWHIWGNTKYEILTMNLHSRARNKLIEVSQKGFLPEQRSIEGF